MRGRKVGTQTHTVAQHSSTMANMAESDAPFVSSRAVAACLSDVMRTMVMAVVLGLVRSRGSWEGSTYKMPRPKTDASTSFGLRARGRRRSMGIGMARIIMSVRRLKAALTYPGEVHS